MATKRRNKMAKVDPQSILGGKISFKEREFKFSEKQQEILACLLDEKTKVVFLSGPSGTSKSFLSIYAALHLLDKDYGKNILYIRTVQECGSKGLGYLPGDQDSKFGPFQIPLEEKCEEIIDESSAKMLFDDGKLQAVPINFIRGQSWKNKIVIFDEIQNGTHGEIKVCLTRLGEGTKIIFCGDNSQIDMSIDKSGFADFVRAFSDEESRERGIYHFKFGTEDIVRSEILKFIVPRIEAMHFNQGKNI